MAATMVERWQAAAFALGVVAGLRSQLPVALLGVAGRRGEIAFGPGPVASWLGSDLGLTLLGLSAVGEAIGDKLPIVPDRTDPGPFLGRIAFGAVAGALVAGAVGEPARAGVVPGALGAVVGTLAGFGYRSTLAARTSVPDPVWAVIEDGAAVALGQFAIAQLRHSGRGRSTAD
jgi:uncharacterized membrane protein